MSVGFTKGKKSWSAQWFECDQMCTMVMHLGVKPPDVESEISPKQGEKIALALKEALKSKKICAKLSKTDSLGREFTVPLRIVCVDGSVGEGKPLPLRKSERAWLLSFIKFCEG